MAHFWLLFFFSKQPRRGGATRAKRAVVTKNVSLQFVLYLILKVKNQCLFYAAITNRWTDHWQPDRHTLRTCFTCKVNLIVTVVLLCLFKSLVLAASALLTFNLYFLGLKIWNLGQIYGFTKPNVNGNYNEYNHKGIPLNYFPEYSAIASIIITNESTTAEQYVALFISYLFIINIIVIISKHIKYLYFKFHRTLFYFTLVIFAFSVFSFSLVSVKRLFDIKY